MSFFAQKRNDRTRDLIQSLPGSHGDQQVLALRCVLHPNITNKQLFIIFEVLM